MDWPDDHRQQGVALFKQCWTLLAEPKTTVRDRTVLECAWASYREWSVVGGPQEWTVGEWMLARCAGEAGYGALAVDTALRAHERARSFEAPDWLLASTSEGVVRAYGDAGDVARATEWTAHAVDEVRSLTNEEDRALVQAQLEDTLARMAKREGTNA